MMKRVAGLLVAAAMLWSPGADAQAFYQVCDCPEWYLHAGALFWRVGSCETRWAGRGVAEVPPDTDTPFLNRDDQYVPHKWRWGFRVEGILNLQHHIFSADYLWLESNGSAARERGIDPADGGFLIIPGVTGNWERAEVSQTVTFQQASVRFNAATCGAPCGTQFYVMGYGRFIDARNRVRTQAENPTVGLDTFDGVVGNGMAQNGYIGAGPGVGFGGRGGFLFGLELYASFGVHSIFGKSTRSFANFAWEPPEDVIGTDLHLELDRVAYWELGFEFDTRFHYGFECGCFKGGIQLGWSTYLYGDALFDLPDAGFTDRGEPGVDNQSPNLLRDAGFKSLVVGGPYINVMVEF